MSTTRCLLACLLLCGGCSRGVQERPRVLPEVEYVGKLERWCAEGQQERCFELGDRLLTGDAIAADPERGTRLLTDACKAEVGRACREVAETCAVPGVWLDVGVLPLGRPEVEVVRR